LDKADTSRDPLRTAIYMFTSDRNYDPIRMSQIDTQQTTARSGRKRS